MSRPGVPTRQDIRQLARMAFWGLVVGFLPQKHWRRLHSALFKLGSVGKRARALKPALPTVHAYREALGADAVECPEAEAEDVLFCGLEDMLCILREYWPGGWQPKFQVRGLEHVAAALARGNGAVLWVAGQRNRLGWKKALHQVGLSVAHLSSRAHGLSATPFGRRYINPLCTNVESRFVERVLIGASGQVAGIRRLRERLAANELVSVHDAGTGGMVRVPFLSGTRSFYVGAPSIAFAAGAALLPLFPIGPVGDRWVIEIGPPIEPPSGCSRQQAVASMTQDFSRQLAERVRTHPQRWFWEGWSAARPVTTEQIDSDGRHASAR